MTIVLNAFCLYFFIVYIASICQVQHITWKNLSRDNKFPTFFFQFSYINRLNDSPFLRLHLKLQLCQACMRSCPAYLSAETRPTVQYIHSLVHDVASHCCICWFAIVAGKQINKYKFTKWKELVFCHFVVAFFLF